MTETHILVSTADSILTIRFNRPDKKNAITTEMYREMAAALTKAEQDDKIIIVKFEGAGDSFTAGNDLADFLSFQEFSADAPVIKFLKALTAFPKILVAEVCGSAVGIGTTMLLHCDFVIAATDTRFQLPFINLGLVPEAASSLLLPARLGYLRAAELLMLGNPFDAQTALNLGLVNRVVDPNDLNKSVEEIISQLSSKDLSALIETKSLLKSKSIYVEDRMDEEVIAFSKRLASPSFKAAAQAFFQAKR